MVPDQQKVVARPTQDVVVAGTASHRTCERAVIADEEEVIAGATIQMVVAGSPAHRSAEMVTHAIVKVAGTAEVGVISSCASRLADAVVLSGDLIPVARTAVDEVVAAIAAGHAVSSERGVVADHEVTAVPAVDDVVSAVGPDVAGESQDVADGEVVTMSRVDLVVS